MAEPISTGATAYAATSTGLAALMVGLIGQVGTDVMMVVLAAIAGCSIALTGQNKNYKDSMFYIIKGILLSIVLAWSVSSAITSYEPQLGTPHLPSTVAFIIGCSVDKIKSIIEQIINKLVSKVV